MKLSKVAIVMFALSALMIGSTPAYAQVLSPAERMAEVDRLIAEAEANISKGKKILLIGAIAEVGGLAVAVSSPDAAALGSIVSLGGAIGLIWGGYTWYQAGSEKSRLQSTRLTITMAPLIQQIPFDGLLRTRYGVEFRVAY